LEQAITTFAHEPKGGLLIMPEAFTSLHRDKIIELAARLRLPAIYPWDHTVSG
jgi:putative ABC transport system substrate-binding protein